MSKNDEGGTIISMTFKNLVGSLRYWTCTHLNILFGVGLVGRFIKTLIITHFKTLKRIRRYIKGTIDFGLFYDYSNSFELVGYSDSDWAVDIERALRVFFSTWEIQYWNGVQTSNLQLLCQHVKMNMSLLHHMFVIPYS
jgi:ABC-type uncharacterized transport system permease subunit